jgi:hypothetical protein
VSPGRGRLFENLLGEPSILYSDLLEDPKRYEEGVAELLLLLITGRKKLSELNDMELNLLDRATIEFSQVHHQKPTALKLPVPTPSEPETSEEKDIPYIEPAKARTVDLAEPPVFDSASTFFDNSKTFWWRK